MLADYHVGDIISINGEEAKVTGRAEFSTKEGSHRVWINRFSYRKDGQERCLYINAEEEKYALIYPVEREYADFHGFREMIAQEEGAVIVTEGKPGIKYGESVKYSKYENAKDGQVIYIIFRGEQLTYVRGNKLQEDKISFIRSEEILPEVESTFQLQIPKNDLLELISIGITVGIVLLFILYIKLR